MSASILEIRNSRRAFADRQALRDVSLDVGEGEIVALLGPNGVGKTTLMRAVAGRLQLDSGSVRVAGRDPVTDSAARGALGVVPQSIALYSQLTARQNLDVLARLLAHEVHVDREIAALDLGAHRTVEDMESLLDTLLMLAREEDLDTPAVDVHVNAVAARQLANVRDQAERSSNQVELHEHADISAKRFLAGQQLEQDHA